jgi:YHS domain-containing protein
MFNLIRFVIICGIIYCVYRLIKWIMFAPRIESNDQRKRPPSEIKSEDLIEDPFCHTYVPLSQAHRAMIDGKAVYFCSQKCCENYLESNHQMKAREAL